MAGPSWEPWPSAGRAAASPGEELPWASEIVQRVQDFFRERDKDQAGFVTRSDMQKLQEEDFPCSTEELELVFDGLDTAGTGRLCIEEFTAGLWQFLSSQKAARDHRRQKTASRRVRLVLPSPALEGVDSEERRHFAAFMDQLGTDNISEEQEIWQLWVKLRQDEPQLLDNLEDFLAKMRHRIQEARSKKEALEVTLNKHVAVHDKEVQQLCEALEQQIWQEQQQLEQESMARSHQHGVELQQALDASEREVQRLVTAQMELETRCRSLRSTQQAASTENRQLEESNRVLENHLQHLHRQLQQTHRRLRTARAAVAREHTEEPGDRAVTELPGEMPLSPQTSPEKSEKYRSEMQIGLGSQSTEPKAKRTHQVVWEMLPAEISVLGALPRVSSVEEDPFPEFLKEERFSDQSSLLREMNDAIAALSKQLKPQALGAPPTLADTACHPRDDAEPQMGPEAAAAHGTTPEVLRETLVGHVGRELFEGDMKEGPATAELRAPDMTQAGASVEARHRRAQEPGAEQGESPEEAQRMLLLQGKGTGVKELMLKAAEHQQGAPGESTEAGEQALVEVEGEGWRQEKAGWEKAQLPEEAEDAALNQGEDLEAGLGPPEAGEAGLAGGWQLATDEFSPAAAPEECVQPRGTGLGEEADPPSGLSKKLEIKPGERLEPEPPSWGEAQMGAAQGDGVLPEVTVAPDPGMLEDERVYAEVQPWGETLDADVPPAPAQHGGSSGAGAEEGEVEVTEPREAEPRLQGESARGDAAWGGSVGAEVLLPPTDVQEGGAGTDVQLLEAQSSDANVQLLAEVEELEASTEADLQPPSEASSLETEQGGSVAPDVQPLEEDDKPELGLGEEMGAAVVHSEGPSPAETPVGSPDLGGLFLVKAQALELVGVEESQADTQLRGDPSPEAPQRGGDHAAMQLGDEDEGRGQGEHELPHEPVIDLHGAGFGQGEGAGAEKQPGAEADECSAGREDSAPLPVVPFGEQRPGAEVDGDVQHPEEEGELELVQGEGINEDGLFPIKAQALERVEAEDSWADTQLRGGASPETPQGGEGQAAIQLGQEAEDGAQGQGEHELPHEPVLDSQGAIVRQGEGAGAGVQPQEEAVILGTLEDQSTDANVQLLAEAVELKLTPGGSTEADLQPPSEAGYLGTEQGGSVAPDVQPPDLVDKPELVEMVEAEDSWADTQLRGGASPETPQGRGDRAGMQLVEEAEDGGQGQDERGLSHEPVLHPHGMAIGQGEGAGAGVQPWEEVVILDMVKDQSTDANVQLLAETDELKSTPGGSTEADLQPSSEASSLGTEQGGSVAPDVQPLGQGAGVGQGEGAGAGVQSREEAVILVTLEDRSTDTSVQPLSEVDELKSTPGGGMEADLQNLSEAGSLDTEQGGSVSPDVQLLDQVDKPELVEMVEAEDSWADTQLPGGASPETPQGGGDRAAVRLREEAEEGTQGQSEHERPHKSVLDPQGAGVGQGEGAGAGVQSREEAVILDTLADQSTDANVQSLIEAEELKSSSGGSTEADLAPLGAAGMQEGQQSQTPGLEAGLCAAHTADGWEGAAGAHVSPPAEAALHPECATAAEGPGLEAMLGALTGPDGQIPEDTQTLEIPQGERADAEERPLGGAQGLEVMQGERLEAGARILVETQSLGIKQGRDDSASALAPPVSEVTLQISTLKLETMMQEDVLVPDVRRLGTSGQAAQSELQEQVSAQADKVRLHAASQQPQEKLPHMMETEQIAARPAEPPKQEVPPASTLHTGVQQEEDAGNDQSGMVLRDSSLGDAANSSTRPQRQLLGEQSEDLNVGQQEKQEVGQKTSQEGEPSRGEPGAVTADGAGEPRGSPESFLVPDHLYNVLFVGDSHVGKTSFLYRLHTDIFNPHHTTTVGLDYWVKNLVVDNKCFALCLWDSAGQERYRSITKQFFRKADGVVLMYDITSECSFSDVRYWLSCIQQGAEDGVAILLLGNKTDRAAERQVPTKEGERLAKEHQLMFYECSAASGHNVSESMVSLIRLLKVREDELKNKAKEVLKPSQKKKGCCW
ncbi:PREDICTED: ras-related protein Rab-44 [Pygoscelis adeliae]|nr:PREDICTED: ras-related protein Rab-44 [Pygoscelis adeliae]